MVCVTVHAYVAICIPQACGAPKCKQLLDFRKPRDRCMVFAFRKLDAWPGNLQSGLCMAESAGPT